MKDKLQMLLVLCNQRVWARFLLCLIPGVIITKVCEFVDAPHTVKLLGTLLMLGGFAVFASWHLIIYRLFPELAPLEDEENENVQNNSDLSSQPTNDDGQSSGQRHVEFVDDLILKCGGDALMAITLIAAEITRDATLSYAQAIELALRRKTVSSRL